MNLPAAKRRNLSRLKKWVLVGGPQDGTVEPWQVVMQVIFFSFFLILNFTIFIISSSILLWLHLKSQKLFTLKPQHPQSEFMGFYDEDWNIVPREHQSFYSKLGLDAMEEQGVLVECQQVGKGWAVSVISNHFRSPSLIPWSWSWCWPLLYSGRSRAPPVAVQCHSLRKLHQAIHFIVTCAFYKALID